MQEQVLLIEGVKGCINQQRCTYLATTGDVIRCTTIIIDKLLSRNFELQ